MLTMLIGWALAAQAIGPGTGADWVRFFDHDEGGGSYYDRATLVRDGNRVRVWARWDRSPEADPPFHEGRVLDELDCSARTVRILRFAAYQRDGSVLAAEENPLEPTTINPGTVGAALADLLCPAR